MPLRLWFDLTTVRRLADAAAAARQRVDLDGTITADVPPALHLMRDCGSDLDDRLYLDGNVQPSPAADDAAAEPFHRTADGRRFIHGITWTEWLGGPPRQHTFIQARIVLGDGRLLDLLRAGHAAGFDMVTIDTDLRLAVARRRPRTRRSRRPPRAGASEPAGPA
ncbi:hypothetical protein [Verrucosispora sp. WMMC514]|uniref:hypothetical protein n=1 Tax=Verrucosispora sp. WMMC514 TaxID=3015156 RepID=UPI00248CF5BA|nr:hypothetical protein [Verrucosispora sp. WMMC514]WBB93394.1 hypothetical protein O7597_10660 [Verrucosispora sp. WMMC514]